jgi:hypothetical protein
VFKNCKLGRKILNYSFFQNEEEVLNLPYTEYKIIDIKKENHNNQLDIVIMEEVFTPYLKFDLNNQPHIFVLWVDG